MCGFVEVLKLKFRAGILTYNRLIGERCSIDEQQIGNISDFLFLISMARQHKSKIIIFLSFVGVVIGTWWWQQPPNTWPHNFNMSEQCLVENFESHGIRISSYTFFDAAQNYTGRKKLEWWYMRFWHSDYCNFKQFDCNSSGIIASQFTFKEANKSDTQWI